MSLSEVQRPAQRPIVADVKCYYCGHVSGQIVGVRGAKLTAGDFVPRPGYEGPQVKQGTRLRCERCRGPVFLEEAPPMAEAEAALARSLRSRDRQDNGSRAA